MVEFSVVELFYYKACQNYIIMSRAISKAITNVILIPAAPLVYKPLQHVIKEDNGWRMIEHVL